MEEKICPADEDTRTAELMHKYIRYILICNILCRNFFVTGTTKALPGYFKPNLKFKKQLNIKKVFYVLH